MQLQIPGTETTAMKALAISVRWSERGYVTVVCSALCWGASGWGKATLHDGSACTEQELADVIECVARTAMADARSRPAS